MVGKNKNYISMNDKRGQKVFSLYFLKITWLISKLYEELVLIGCNVLLVLLIGKVSNSAQ
jgi:hypothetical protein